MEEVRISSHGKGEISFEGIIGRACPAAGTFRLRAELTDSRGFIAKDEVEISIETTSKDGRLQVQAAVVDGDSTLVSGGTLYVPFKNLTGVVSDVLLEPVYNSQSCDILPAPNLVDYQWSSEGLDTHTGADYLIQDSFFGPGGGRKTSRTLDVTHRTVSTAKTSITLVPCDFTPFDQSTLPVLEGYARCPDQQLAEMLRGGLHGVASDIFRERREIDIMVMFQDRLHTLFGGHVPDPFPGYGDSLAGMMTDPYLGIMVYELYGAVQWAESVSQLREHIVGRAVTAGKFLAPKELENYMYISTMAETHLNFFSSYGHGGEDGWWYLDSLATADAFSEQQVIGLVRTALDGFMTEFHFNNAAGQATLNAMKLGTEAAELSALMGAVQLGGFL